jgi:hypothetical protein
VGDCCSLTLWAHKCCFCCFSSSSFWLKPVAGPSPRTQCSKQKALSWQSKAKQEDSVPLLGLFRQPGELIPSLIASPPGDRACSDIPYPVHEKHPGTAPTPFKATQLEFTVEVSNYKSDRDLGVIAEVLRENEHKSACAVLCSPLPWESLECQKGRQPFIFPRERGGGTGLRGLRAHLDPARTMAKDPGYQWGRT